jgi:hypothetical protein
MPPVIENGTLDICQTLYPSASVHFVCDSGIKDTKAAEIEPAPEQWGKEIHGKLGAQKCRTALMVLQHNFKRFRHPSIMKCDNEGTVLA